MQTYLHSHEPATGKARLMGIGSAAEYTGIRNRILQKQGRRSQLLRDERLRCGPRHCFRRH